jgi:rRNA-processing protein FCF1
MNWKKGFGIGLMFVGLFLIVVNAGITGNVIGFSEANSFEVLGYLGVIVFLVGSFFIFMAKKRGVPMPGGLEDIVQVVEYEFDRSADNPDYRQFEDPDEIILDSNSIISLYHGFNSQNDRILAQIFDNPNYRITVPESVLNELRGLSTSRGRSIDGRKQTIPKKVFNYIFNRVKNNPNYSLESDVDYAPNQIDYLRRKWDDFGDTREGRRLIHGIGKDFNKDLINVADGKIAITAYEKALNGDGIFVFTDDTALKGVLREMNRDLSKDKKPNIIYGGMKDWEKYYAGYSASAVA